MITATESQLIRIISEAICSKIGRKPVLTESQESESIKGATLLYMERTGKSKEEADKFVRINLRAKFPPLRDKKIGKFILGVMRMYLDGQLEDAATVTSLNSTLKYVGDPTHINEYDRNLNGMSAQDLIERFAPARMQDMEKDKAELGKAQYTAKNEYKVVRIDSFEQARQYGKYNDWCLAQPNGKNMYDSYTSEGTNQLYIILRDGFEKEPDVAGPNTPYDSYGLSMMTVIVDPYGQMTQSTTRWNHANGSNDSAFTPKTISEVIGRNFYEVFKPNTKLKDGIENALNRLKSGESPNDIFDDYGWESDGMRLVKLMGKWNYLTKDNQFLMAQWVDEARDFQEGFAHIAINRKYNFINTKGEIISKTWFDEIGYFKNGFARVRMNKKWNFINTKGELLSKTWFDGIENFENGFARVEMNDAFEKYNLINTKGEIISKTWFDEIGPFYEGFVVVYIEKIGSNFINTKGEIISKNWFDSAGNFFEGFANVMINGKGWNFINTKGEIISKNWFDSAGNFSEGFANVMINGKGWNFINTKGEIILKNWFDWADVFSEGFAHVKVNGKGHNFINTKSEIISKTWFDEVRNFQEGFAQVKVNEKGWNYINTEGNFLSKIWFTFAYNFTESEYALILYKGKYYMIDKNGILYDNKDFKNGKKTPVTLNEETIKGIVRKVLMESLDENILKMLTR